MRVGEYDIPEGYESMSCIYDCGFLLVWQNGSPESLNAGLVMDGHLAGHEAPKPSIWDFFRFGKGNDGY
jgi:hypothetical protein|tara:strand:+ start:3662 stop:3868 length:207 start_codon:yes stop_codon:yes gene_type:complete